MQPRETWYHFAIEEVNSKVSLVRKPADGDRPTVSQNLAQTMDGTHIKIEDSSDTATSPLPAALSTALVTTTNNTKHSAIIACYTHIFASFYNISPKLSTTSLPTALSQSANLIALATDLGCVHLLQAHLANIFASYRQDLYIGIAQDPPRRLHLSLALENCDIYTECLFHLVGAHPKMPWPTHRTAIPEPIQHIVQQKAAELAALRADVERELLLITLHTVDPFKRNPRHSTPATPPKSSPGWPSSCSETSWPSTSPTFPITARPRCTLDACTAGSAAGTGTGCLPSTSGRCWSRR
ncbi:hypothetical protein PMIN06_008386 [Paraphaeosphaeria minitans]